MCGGGWGVIDEDVFCVARTFQKVVQIQTSDSSMFDGREAVDRLDNPDQAAVYWAKPRSAET